MFDMDIDAFIHTLSMNLESNVISDAGLKDLYSLLTTKNKILLLKNLYLNIKNNHITDEGVKGIISSLKDN